VITERLGQIANAYMGARIPTCSLLEEISARTSSRNCRGVKSAASDHLLESQCRGFMTTMSHIQLWGSLALMLGLSSVLGCGNKDSTTTGSSCGSFSACGGSLDGTWQFDSACISGDIVAATAAQAGLPSACNGFLKSVQTTTTGTVTFASGTQTNNVTTTVLEGFVYTPACLSAEAGGTVAVTASVCTQLQTSITARLSGSTATCSFVSGNCNCSVTYVSTDTSTNTYTISGNTLVPSGSSDPLDYCVSGTTLRGSETSSSMSGITTYYTMHKI